MPAGLLSCRGAEAIGGVWGQSHPEVKALSALKLIF